MPRSGVSRRRLLASLGAAPVASMMQRAQARVSEEDRTDPGVHTELLCALTIRLRPIVESPEAQPSGLSGRAIIDGGEAAGPLSGNVLPGFLEWSQDAMHGVMRLSLHYGVETRDGRRLQLVDRATVAARSDSLWDRPITTTTEFECVADPLAAASGLVIGRLEAGNLAAGTVRLDLLRVV